MMGHLSSLAAMSGGAMLLQPVLHGKLLSALISSYEWIDHDSLHAGKTHEPLRCTHIVTMLAAEMPVSYPANTPPPPKPAG